MMENDEGRVCLYPRDRFKKKKKKKKKMVVLHGGRGRGFGSLQEDETT